MNFATLQRALRGADEIRALNAVAQTEDALFSAMALLRREQTVLLCAVERVEQAEPVEGETPRPRTQREFLLARGDEQARDLSASVCAARIGKEEFAISEATGSSLEDCEPEDLLLLADILRAGYRPPRELRKESFSFLRLCAWKLDGAFDRLPEGDLTALRTREDSVQHACREGEYDLPVGPADEAPCTYLDAATGERRTFWLQRVELLDLNPDRERPEDMPPRAWENFRRDLERQCPRGMRVPALFYEEEGNRQIDFFDEAYLSTPLEPPKGLGGASGFAILRNSRETGPHGLPLRAALLQTPVPPDAKRVRAEALRCFVPVPAGVLEFHPCVDGE